MSEQLICLTDLVKRLKREDENIDDKDLERIAEEFGNLDYLFMHDCIFATECPAFGMCSICLTFDRTIVISNGKTLHYNEGAAGFTIDGGFSFRHFLAHDGRLYHIKEDQIILDRQNRPSEEDLDNLKELYKERQIQIERMRKEYEKLKEERKKRGEKFKTSSAYA